MTITHLLLDIEGTTCPVSFVSAVLFPYAKQSLSSYLNDHQEDSDLKSILQAAEREWDESHHQRALTFAKPQEIKT